MIRTAIYWETAGHYQAAITRAAGALPRLTVHRIQQAGGGSTPRPVQVHQSSGITPLLRLRWRCLRRAAIRRQAPGGGPGQPLQLLTDAGCAICLVVLVTLARWFVDDMDEARPGGTHGR